MLENVLLLRQRLLADASGQQHPITMKPVVCHSRFGFSIQISMERLSQLSLHIASGTSGGSASEATLTPHRTEDGDMTTNMAKTKVVVTRQLIDEAQRILDAKKEELDIVQWDSEKVCSKFVYNIHIG
jgi:hypothetical protein